MFCWNFVFFVVKTEEEARTEYKPVGSVSQAYKILLPALLKRDAPATLLNGLTASNSKDEKVGFHFYLRVRLGLRFRRQ
jgi:hypothetical protein